MEFSEQEMPTFNYPSGLSSLYLMNDGNLGHPREEEHNPYPWLMQTQQPRQEQSAVDYASPAYQGSLYNTLFNNQYGSTSPTYWQDMNLNNLFDPEEEYGLGDLGTY